MPAEASGDTPWSGDGSDARPAASDAAASDAAASAPRPGPAGPGASGPGASGVPSGPVPSGRPGPAGPSRQTALLLTSGLAVLAAVLLVIFVLRLSRKPGAQVNLGAQEFNMGRAAAFAPVIARVGPLVFPPPRGRQLTLYVQHLGTDVKHGWLAFDAHDPGQPATCLLRWQAAHHDFVDPCNHAVFPAGGQGLVQYAAQVDRSGDVVIDLRQPLARSDANPTTTTLR